MVEDGGGGWGGGGRLGTQKGWGSTSDYVGRLQRFNVLQPTQPSWRDMRQYVFYESKYNKGNGKLSFRQSKGPFKQTHLTETSK